MKTLAGVLLCSLLLSSFAVIAHSATSYEMKVLPVAAIRAEAYDINNKGEIVGYASDNAGYQYAWKYDANGFDLGMGGYSAEAINNNSVIAGDRFANNPNLAMYAHTYSGGAWHLLNTASGIVTSNATDISDLGSVVGFCTLVTQGATDWISINSAFLCKDGVTTTFPNLGGNSYAEGINTHDQVVGYWRESRDWADDKAFLWDGVTVTWLPMLEGATSSRAWAINDSGAIVGDCGGSPVIWENGGVRALAASGYAWDINELGQIAGMIGSDTGCIWDGSTTYNLGSHNLPWAINDSGVAVGYTASPAWSYLQPAVWTPVPEPGPIVCLLSGLSAVAVAFRRRRT